MDDHDRRDAALELLSSNERKLVAGILRRGAMMDSSEFDAPHDADEIAWVRMSQLRLRNMVEKHSEALKRARLSARSRDPGEPFNEAERIELQLWICSEALALCRRQLQALADRD